MKKVDEIRPSLKDLDMFKQGSSLAARTEQVMNQAIDWNTYVNLKRLNNEDLGLIQDYEQAHADEKTALLDERGAEYARLFVKILDGIQDDQVTQKTLALVDDLLTVSQTRRRFFKSNDESLYSPFLQIFTRNAANEFCVAKAAHILAILLSGEEEKSQSLVEFVSKVVSRFDTLKGSENVFVAEALKVLLKAEAAQNLFVHEQGLKCFVTILKKETQNTQLLYYVGFCVWLLTFNKKLHGALLASELMHRLVDVLKQVTREKVVRIILNVFRNVMGVENFNEHLIGGGLLKLLPTLLARRWNDDDLPTDLKIIEENLREHVKLLSSFEKYRAELLSGGLEWTPVHNEGFWRENATKFEDDNLAHVKKLIELLGSNEDVCVEVACYDLGEFGRFAPNGKRILDKLGGKRKLMTLMTSKNQKIAKQALLAVQKLMVQNWESLNSSMKSS